MECVPGLNNAFTLTRIHYKEVHYIEVLLYYDDINVYEIIESNRHEISEQYMDMRIK
jgi:hypothetical protein